MITDVVPFSTVDDNNRLPLEERVSNSLRVMRETQEYNKAKKKQDYTTADKLGASLREFGIGFRSMHERALSLQSSYPYTKGLPRDDRFVLSDRYRQLIKDNKVSTDDSRALMEQGIGNEQEFYLARAKQERYNQDQEIIKDMSPLALITTGIGVSIFDPSSWALGGIVGKAFHGLYTGAKVGKYTLLGLRGAEGATTAGLINYATEKTNQEAAGVRDDEKLLQLTSYGAAFGLALPVLPTAITQISQGAYRSRGAQIAKEYMQTNPVTSSLRKYLSLGAGEQTKWQSTNPLVQEYSWAIAPSTGIRRAPDGTPVVQRTTAMELKAEYVEGNLKQAFEGLQANAKQYGSGAKAWAEASKADGSGAVRVIGEAEQSYGATIGQLTPTEKIAHYKRIKNIDELPEEAARRVEIEKITRELQQVESSYISNQRNVQATIKETLKKELQEANRLATEKFKKLSEKDKKEYLKAKEASLKEQQRLESEYNKKLSKREQIGKQISKEITQAKNAYNKKTSTMSTKIDNLNKDIQDSRERLATLVSDNSKRGLLRKKQLKDKIEKTQEKLKNLERQQKKIKEPDYEAIKKELIGKLPEDVKEVPQRTFSFSEELNLALRPTKQEVSISPQEALAIQKKIQSRFDATMQKMETQVKKLRTKIEELKTKPLQEPDDLFNVLRADLHKQAVATGKFKLPPNLEYIGKFFKSFSDTATKLNVPGIAGREGYGYFPVRYNREFAISNPVGYKQQMEQAIRTDSYNMALIQRGELTDEDILAQVERFYQKAIDDDVRYKYLEKGVKSGSGSSSKARTVHINRRDFPELFVEDVTEVLGAYAREQGGRNAFIEAFGIDPYAKGSTPRGTIDSILKEVADKGRELGITPKKVNKDVENLRAMLEGVLDVRRIQIDPNTFTNTAVRVLKGLASTVFSAGFVKYNAVEWLSGAVHTDFSKTVKNYLPAMDAVIKDIRGLPTNSPEFEAMRHTILASHSLMGQMFSRLDANELTGRLSIIENGIHGINNGIRKFSGFNITTDINEVAIAGAGMKKLFSLNPDNLTVRDVEWLSRYGFSPDELKAVINNKDIKRDKEGGIVDYNLDDWKDQRLARQFSVFMERVARDAIPVPNASTLHRFQSDVNDPIKSLFFQYTQVPTVLWDKVFLTVADRPTADAIMGLGMATLGMYTIFKLDDELKVRLGLQEELTDDKEIFTRAFLSTGFVGVGGMGATAALTALGMEVSGVTYRGDTDLLSQVAGAGGSMLKRASDMLKAIGSGDVEKGATIINNSNFLNAFPFLGNFFKAGGKKLIEGMNDE